MKLPRIPFTFLAALTLMIHATIGGDYSTALADDSKPAVRLVAVLPLTGPIAWVGQAFRRGIELAAKESSEYSVDVSFEDDLSSNRAAAVTIFKKATSTSPEVILNCSTSTLSAISPVINRSQTPTVVIWDSNRDMPQLSPFTIGFGYSNEKAAEDAATFLVKTKGKRKIAVFSYINDWSELLTKAFTKHVPELGGTIVLSESVDGSNTDFRSLIVRAKQQGADALYLPLFGAGLVSALKQVNDLRFDGPILTVDSLGEDELRDAGRAAEGIFVSQIVLEDPSFAGRLATLFPGSNPSSVNIGYSALAYDTTRFVLEGVTRRLQKGTTLIAQLKNTSFSGALGSTQVSSEGIADRTIPILTVRDGRFMKE